MVAQQTRKLKIIESILHIEDNGALDSIEAVIEESSKKEIVSKPNIKDAIRPIRSNVSLEQLRKEQNDKQITYNEFRAVADELEESITCHNTIFKFFPVNLCTNI